MKYRYREPHEMKDSDVEWLGMIPKEWIVKRLKYLSVVETGDKDTQDREENGEYPFFVRSENVETSNDYSYDCEAILTAGDGAIGKIFHYYNGKFECHQRVYKISNFKEVIGKYLFYYIKDNFIKEVEKLSAKTTVDSLRKPMFLNFSVSYPCINSQNKIANFLDEKCSQFDSIIEKKEALIKKLEEAKKSLISEVVTGKVKVIEKDNGEYELVKRDPSEIKDSGVEWLGMIPKDWEIKKLKYLFDINKRIAGTEGYDVLSITQKGIKLKDIITGGGQLSMDYSKYQLVYPGDFAMNHMDLLTGYVDISNFFGVTSPDYRVFTLKNKMGLSKYFLLLLQMGYKNKIFFGFGQGSAQLGRWRFSTEQFNNFKFPYPSIEEQEEIALIIPKKLREMDSVIDKTKFQIEKLKSAKQSLISEAVTGKIEIL